MWTQWPSWYNINRSCLVLVLVLVCLLTMEVIIPLSECILFVYIEQNGDFDPTINNMTLNVYIHIYKYCIIEIPSLHYIYNATSKTCCCCCFFIFYYLKCSKMIHESSTLINRHVTVDICQSEFVFLLACVDFLFFYTNKIEVIR